MTPEQHLARRASNTTETRRAKVLTTEKAAEMRKGRDSHLPALRHAVR